MSGVPGQGFTTRQVQLIAVCTTCLTLSTVAVGLRLLVRRVASTAHPWWDDWITVLALFTSWLVNAFTLLGIKDGLGRHEDEVDKSHAVPFGISVWIQQLFWVLSMGLIIIAILVFYLRIFPNKWFKNAVYTLGALMVTWMITCFLLITFQCTPVQFFWNPKIEGGHCIDTDAFYFASAIISTILLVSVLCLPLPIIWRLRVSTMRKVGLAFSFTIGAFVCISSVVRLVVLLQIKSEDLMYTSALPQLWSCVEASFGVISACVPSLTPLFLLLIGRLPSVYHKGTSFDAQHTPYRSSRNNKGNFNGMVDLRESNPPGTSLELIVQHSDRSTEPSVERGNAMGLAPGEIKVTKQINQISQKRPERIEGDGMDVVGYKADAGTQKG